jgi:hypothetical protein
MHNPTNFHQNVIYKMDKDHDKNKLGINDNINKKKEKDHEEKIINEHSKNEMEKIKYNDKNEEVQKLM